MINYNLYFIVAKFITYNLESKLIKISKITINKTSSLAYKESSIVLITSIITIHLVFQNHSVTVADVPIVTPPIAIMYFTWTHVMFA